MRAVICLLAVLPFSACESDWEYELRPAQIIYSDHGAVFNIPDTVTAGVPFDVTVRVYSGGCKKPGPTFVANGSTRAIIVPRTLFVTRTPEGFGCDRDLRFEQRTTRLVFDEPGEGSVAIAGTSYHRDGTTNAVRFEEIVTVVRGL